MISCATSSAEPARASGMPAAATALQHRPGLRAFLLGERGDPGVQCLGADHARQDDVDADAVAAQFVGESLAVGGERRPGGRNRT